MWCGEGVSFDVEAEEERRRGSVGSEAIVRRGIATALDSRRGPTRAPTVYGLLRLVSQFKRGGVPPFVEKWPLTFTCDAIWCSCTIASRKRARENYKLLRQYHVVLAKTSSNKACIMS